MITASLLPVFTLIALGALTRRYQWIKADYWGETESLIYYLFFPCLLVNRLSQADLNAVPLFELFITIIVSLSVLALFMQLGSGWFAPSKPGFTSVFQGGIRFNTFIAMACADAIYGPNGLAIMAVVMAIMIPAVNFLCILMFNYNIQTTKGGFAALGVNVAKNPLIISCMAGLLINLSDWQLPTWFLNTLGLLGACALPLGLMAVGVAMELKAIKGEFRSILFASLFKFLILPVLILSIAIWLELPDTAMQILLLAGIMPTASSGYILARKMGGDTRLMANIITIQTLMALAVIPAWLLYSA